MDYQTRNAHKAREILNYYSTELQFAPCSRGHHLAEKGGLLKHLEGVFNVAYKYFPDDYQLQFLALIHDIGKARTYQTEDEKIGYAIPNTDHVLNTIVMLERFGIRLTPEELNAIQFHHGGWSKYEGQLTQLAVKLHFCDMLSTVIESE
jgi:hypothetical protein